MFYGIDFYSVTDNPITFAWWFFKTIGWVYPAGLFFYACRLYWLEHIRHKYIHHRKYIVLAIDVPKNNEQSPKAMENFFNHLAGAHQDIKFLQKWWDGEIPDSFTFEIVSLGGYIQFLVHTVDKYRDLIEAIFYAQYPDAEITEVEDYTKDWNIKFPNDDYELWGTELKMTHDEIFPIKTFRDFEDTLTGEYKDTMASMLEALSRIGPHEQIWVQFVLTPADNDWGAHGKHAVDKIIKRKGAHGGGGGHGHGFGAKIADFVYEAPFKMLHLIESTFEPAAEHGGHDEPETQMLHLTPGEKAKVEGIENKTSKIGFHAKIRLIYFAEKAHFKKPTASNVLYGSFKQFNTTSNGFKPYKQTYTGGIRFFKQKRLIWRKNKILRRFKERGHHLHPHTYGTVLNTEELASLYHFPIMTVKAPLVKKTEGKKSEPPITLPIEQAMLIPHGAKASEAPHASPPENLPFEE